MRRTNGSRKLGQKGSRGQMNESRMRQPERLQGRNSQKTKSDSSYKTEKEDTRYAQGHSGGYNNEDKWQDSNSTDSYSERGMSEKSREKQDKGVYSTIEEDDVRSELDYRSNSKGGTGLSGRGSDLMDENRHWKMANEEETTKDSGGGNESERSMKTGRIGKRKRIAHVHE